MAGASLQSHHHSMSSGSEYPKACLLGLFCIAMKAESQLTGHTYKIKGLHRCSTGLTSIR